MDGTRQLAGPSPDYEYITPIGEPPSFHSRSLEGFFCTSLPTCLPPGAAPPPNPQLTTAHVRPQALVVGSPKPLPLLVAVSSFSSSATIASHHPPDPTFFPQQNAQSALQSSKVSRHHDRDQFPGSKNTVHPLPSPSSSPLSPCQARPLNQLAVALGYQPFELPAIYRLPHWVFCAARLHPPSHVWPALHNASLAFRLIHMMHAYACISACLYVSS
jgi:hypothetical protein